MTQQQDATSEGSWIAAPCWHNCGGRCLIKVLVKDGKVLRSKTDDTHPDRWESPQLRSCPMGHAMRQQIYGEDRLKYPMKRKHWKPFTGGDKSLRGRDEWVQISWDEALGAIAAELEHAKDNYGCESIFYMNMMNLEGYLGGILSAFGGYVDCSGTQSTGTFNLHNELFGLVGDQYSSNCNDRMDLENSDYVVLYGHNASWCAQGNPSFFLKHAKEKGCKFVYVGPDYNATAGFTNAEWIPVRPGEDTALLLGTAYAMLEKDENGSYIDWDFLNRCTVGFDADHMPAEAKSTENFEGYLKGEYDGIPKTPEWASAICGTPVELIYRFADILSCQNDVSIHCCPSPARSKGSENFPQTIMTIAAMGGHFGKPGNACANAFQFFSFNSGAITSQPYGGPPARMTGAGNPVTHVLSTDSMWDNIIDGYYYCAGNNFPGFPEYAVEKRDIDIHVIISETNNMLATQANTNKGIEAFRSVDFVCAQAYYFKMDARYADIVLPVSTRWERQQSNFYSGFMTNSDKEHVPAWRKVIEPLYDTKTDIEIAQDIAKRLGIDTTDIFPKTEEQLWFEQMAGVTVLQEDGTWKPMIEVTQEDIDRYGAEFEPQSGEIPFEEFVDKGVFEVPRSADDRFVNIEYRAFREDPEANPLGTASGKMEIYCQKKSDYFEMVNGYEDGKHGELDFVNASPLPKYLDHPFGYKEAKDNAYPFQMTHNHYPRRAHTDCDSIPWLREVWQNPVFINELDAAERGISQGDVIKVYNEQGAFLRPATVTPTIMPGCIVIPHGATPRIDEETGFDLAGADNILTPSNRTTTPFLNGWNSVLVNYEKYDGPIELKPDAYVDPILPIMAE